VGQSVNVGMMGRGAVTINGKTFDPNRVVRDHPMHGGKSWSLGRIAGSDMDEVQ
jgi:hypothetical protein